MFECICGHMCTQCMWAYRDIKWLKWMAFLLSTFFIEVGSVSWTQNSFMIVWLAVSFRVFWVSFPSAGLTDGLPHLFWKLLSHLPSLHYFLTPHWADLDNPLCSCPLQLGGASCSQIVYNHAQWSLPQRAWSTREENVSFSMDTVWLVSRYAQSKRKAVF